MWFGLNDPEFSALPRSAQSERPSDVLCPRIPEQVQFELTKNPTSVGFFYFRIKKQIQVLHEAVPMKGQILIRRKPEMVQWKRLLMEGDFTYDIIKRKD